MNKILLLALVLSFGCYRVENKIEPQISYHLEESYLDSLKPAFPSITFFEKEQEWGKEYAIAVAFARKLDLYRAVSTFKRAQILIPEQMEVRKLEIDYNILLCYFLAKKYSEVIEEFETSELSHVDKTFRPFHDLLIILYGSYIHLGEQERANSMFELLEKNYPESSKKIELSMALTRADIEQVEILSENTSYKKDLDTLLATYESKKKSITKAQVLNGIIPGTGYLYVGQKKSALTSFVLNGLFIGTATHFFLKGQITAGIITTGFELGWYFGGVHGAGLEARYYNERVYEEITSSFMNHYRLFPVFSLHYGF